MIMISLHNLVIGLVIYFFIGALVSVGYTASLMSSGRKLSVQDRLIMVTVVMSWPIYLIMGWVERRRSDKFEKRFPKEKNVEDLPDWNSVLKRDRDGFEKLCREKGWKIPWEIQPAPIFPHNEEGKKPNVKVEFANSAADDGPTHETDVVGDRFNATFTAGAVSPVPKPEPIVTSSPPHHDDPGPPGKEGQPGISVTPSPPIEAKPAKPIPEQPPLNFLTVIPPEKYEGFTTGLMMVPQSTLNNPQQMEELRDSFDTFDMADKSFDTLQFRAFWVQGEKVKGNYQYNMDMTPLPG